MQCPENIENIEILPILFGGFVYLGDSEEYSLLYKYTGNFLVEIEKVII